MLRALANVLLLASVGWAQPGPLQCQGQTHQSAERTQEPVELVVPAGLAEVPEVRELVREIGRGKAAWARKRLLELRMRAPPDRAAKLDLVVALADAKLGWRAEAEAAFEAAAARWPELNDFVLEQRVLAARAAGEDDLADELTLSLGPMSGRLPELVFAVTGRALDEGRPADALQALGKLEGHLYWRWNRARAALWRAQAERALAFAAPRVDPRPAEAAWLRAAASVWRRWPGTEAAAEAEAALVAALHDRRVAPPVELGELVERAAEQARTGKADRGRALARAARARFGERAAELGTTLLLERHPRTWGRRTIREATEAIERAEDPFVRARLALRRGKAARRIGRVDDALRYFATLDGCAAEPPETLGACPAEPEGPFAGPSVGAALLQGGELADRLGRHRASRWFHERFVERTGPDAGAARAKALWKAAWASWRLQRFDSADRHLARLMNEHPSAQDHSRRTYYERAAYWRARVAERRGDLAEAHRRWRFVMERFPSSYYASLSRRWLMEGGLPVDLLGTTCAATTPPRPHEVRPVGPEAAAGVTLWDIGLLEESRRSLRRGYDLGRLGRRGVELLSAVYRERPDWWRSHWVMQWGDPLDVSPEGPERSRWLAAYPRPFAKLVEREAREHDIDPLLIWAVMRQESAFRTTVRSHASALGLMQVLHPTARLVARKYLGEPEPSLEKVLSPWGNVHYGAAYLRHLLNWFDGHLPLAIAGYNAGPGAVDDWLERFGDLELDEFVEQIPYDEARGYTRKVLRSYAAYRALYGPANQIEPWEIRWRLPQRRAPAVAGVPRDGVGSSAGAVSASTK